MEATPKLTGTEHIVHERKRKLFELHKHKFDKHRAKGPAFAAALDALEATLFGRDEI